MVARRQGPDRIGPLLHEPRSRSEASASPRGSLDVQNLRPCPRIPDQKGAALSLNKFSIHFEGEVLVLASHSNTGYTLESPGKNWKLDFFFQVLGFDLRALHLLGKVLYYLSHSTSHRWRIKLEPWPHLQRFWLKSSGEGLKSGVLYSLCWRVSYVPRLRTTKVGHILRGGGGGWKLPRDFKTGRMEPDWYRERILDLGWVAEAMRARKDFDFCVW
jgi:hypothetical protein